jgi:tetratricopeptide (TPR) repeat protein
MKRVGLIALTILTATPVWAAAQSKPASTMHTNSAELYFEKGIRSKNEAEKRQMFEKTLELARQGIAARADNPKAYLIAGRALMLLGNVLAADSMFDKAEALWPEYIKETENDRLQAGARAFNAGVLALRDNKADEALVAFQTADAVWVNRPTAKLNIAQIYTRKNQPEQAAAAYRGALEVLRGPARKGLKAEEEKQWKEFEEAATFNLAQILASQGKNEEALATYRDFLSRTPDNPVVMGNMAVVLSRMGKTDEATQIFTRLLAMDLSDIEFFNVGVGLFRANQYVPASEAFRKAVSKNPHLRDAYYNMAQAQYALARELNDERDKVKADAVKVKAVDAKLQPVLAELAQVTEKLRSIDPASRNAHIIQAYAYRSLGDITTGATSTEWKNKTLATLTASDKLTFDVQDVSIGVVGEDIQLAGAVVNLKGKPGDPVKLRFTFLGRNGQELATQEVTAALPEVQGATPFKVTFKSKDEVAGWKYVVL